MSNKAANDKSSIIIDVENCLDVFEPAFMRMPKIRRIHGAAVRMEDALYDIIDNFYIAYTLGKEDIDEKKRYIRKMIGAFGRVSSTFKRLMRMKLGQCRSNTTGDFCRDMSLFSNSVSYEIARHLEKIEEGIRKWSNSVK